MKFVIELNDLACSATESEVVRRRCERREGGSAHTRHQDSIWECGGRAALITGSEHPSELAQQNEKEGMAPRQDVGLGHCWGGGQERTDLLLTYKV